jgi:hypothetical protein
MKKYDIIKFDQWFGYIYDVIYRDGKEFIIVKFSEKVGGTFEEVLEPQHVVKIGRVIRFK